MEYFDNNNNNAYNNLYDNDFDSDDRLVKVIMFEIFYKINSLLYNPFILFSIQKAFIDFFETKSIQEQCTEESLIQLHEAFLVFTNLKNLIFLETFKNKLIKL